MHAWFGPKPFAPLCEHYPHSSTPVGQPCVWCGERIAADDDGVLMPHFAEGALTTLPWHAECEMRASVGGYNHLKKLKLLLCTCCGGTEPPDPVGWTRREQALMACIEWRRQREAKR